MRLLRPTLLAAVILCVCAPAAQAGRIVLVSADLGEHCSDSAAMCTYLSQVVRHVRAGSPNPSRPILLLDRDDLTFMRGMDIAEALGGPAVPRTIVEPRSAAFAAIALDPARFSAVVVGSDASCGIGRGGDCGTLNERDSSPDSDALTARAGELASFVSAGGGLLMLSGGNHGDGQRSGGVDSYYQAIPAPTLHRADAGPFTLTAAGRAIGITDGRGSTLDELNCRNCSTTHNAFDVDVDDPVWHALVRGSNGLAAAVSASGSIAGGVLTPDPVVPPAVAPVPPASPTTTTLTTPAATTASTPPATASSPSSVTIAPAIRPVPLGKKKPAPVFVDGKSVTLPPTRRCVSRRHFRIHLQEIGGIDLVWARVRFNHRRLPVRRGRMLSAFIDLRGLPSGRFTVWITARTSTGRTLHGTRRYYTCRRKLPGGHPQLRRASAALALFGRDVAGVVHDGGVGPGAEPVVRAAVDGDRRPAEGTTQR